MLLEVVVGEKVTKTNKNNNTDSKSQVKSSSLKLITIIVHKNKIVEWTGVSVQSTLSLLIQLLVDGSCIRLDNSSLESFSIFDVPYC